MWGSVVRVHPDQPLNIIMIDLPSNTFCVFPFTQLVIHNFGAYGPCCSAEEYTSVDYNGNQVTAKLFDPDDRTEHKPYGMTANDAFHSEFMKDIRQQLLNGEKPTACNRCWRDEKIPLIKSKRIGNNGFYLGLEDKFKGIFDYDVDEMVKNPQLHSLDLKFDNKCNLHCLMCSSGSSDMWVPLDNKIHNYLALQNINADDTNLYLDDAHAFSNSFTPPEFPDSLFEEIKSLVPQLQEIQCTGGEPFINSHFIELLKYIIDTGHAEHISLEVTTNGTKFVTEVMEILAHFRHVRFLVSIDGTEGTYEYIRAPFSYNLLLERLQTLDEYLVSEKIKGWVEISAVAMSYNIFDYANLSTIVKNMKYNNVQYMGNVQFSLYNKDNTLHIKWLSDDLINNALQYYKSLPQTNTVKCIISGFNGYLDNNQVDLETKLHNQRRMKNYTVLMDKMLNRDYHDFLDPRICEFLDSVSSDI